MLPKKTVSARGEQVVWVKCGKHEKRRQQVCPPRHSQEHGLDGPREARSQRASTPRVQLRDVGRDPGHTACDRCSSLREFNCLVECGAHGGLTRLLFWRPRTLQRACPTPFGFVFRTLDRRSESSCCQARCPAEASPPFTDVALSAGGRRVDEATEGRVASSLGFLLARTVGHPRAPYRGDVVKWVTNGWNDISESTIIRGFSKCGFRSPERETECDVEDAVVDASEVLEELRRHGCLDGEIGKVEDSMDVVDVVPAAQEGIEERMEAVV